MMKLSVHGGAVVSALAPQQGGPGSSPRPETESPMGDSVSGLGLGPGTFLCGVCAYVSSSHHPEPLVTLSCP